ncbi:MAG: efflux RND transporter periplasmic adaptor subunit [Planctomycetota bacterium]
MRTLFLYVLALAAVAAGIRFGFPEWFGAVAKRDELVVRSSSVPPVVVAETKMAPFADSLEALGTVRANESIEVNANRADRVVAIHFADGQDVDKGQLLVELQTAEEEAELREAEAVLAQRVVVFEQAKQLLAEGVRSQGEFDVAHAELEAAQARIQRLQATIADHKVTAPFAGTLGFRRVSVGAYVQTSTVLTTLDDLSTVKVDFTVPESWMPAIAPGMRVGAHSDAFPGADFEGSVQTVDTRLDERTRSATVRTLFDNPEHRLRPGMLLVLNVDRGEQPVLQVPEEAIIPRGDRAFVLRVRDDAVAEEVAVQIGRRRVGAVEVVAGLQAGDRVVVEGLVRVQAGAPVDVVRVRQTTP